VFLPSLPYTTKTFIACSSGHQVMAISLALPPDSREAKQNPSLLTDHMLTLMDVGEILCMNFGSGSFSEIDTETNEVGGTYPIGNKPVFGIVDVDNSTLWVSNFGSDSINLWSVDDGKMENS